MGEKAENVTASLMQILLEDSTKFVDTVFARRSKEIEDMMTPAEDGADKYGKFTAMAEDLAKKYGYQMTPKIEGDVAKKQTKVTV